MNKTVTIEQHNTNPTRFGGIINFSDYTTEGNRTISPDSESHIIRRIVSDENFDEEQSFEENSVDDMENSEEQQEYDDVEESIDDDDE